jgi:hypothetical protein
MKTKHYMITLALVVPLTFILVVYFHFRGVRDYEMSSREYKLKTGIGMLHDTDDLMERSRKVPADLVRYGSKPHLNDNRTQYYGDEMEILQWQVLKERMEKLSAERRLPGVGK